MEQKTVGELIKEARAKAGFSQAYMAEQIDGLSATDISKAERGEKELSQVQLKAIAKLLKVTQKSLLEAPFGKPGAAVTTTSQKPSTQKPSTQTNVQAADAFKLTNTEKNLVELYRKADSDTKKRVMNLLKGKEDEPTNAQEMIQSLLGDVMGQILNAKK